MTDVVQIAIITSGTTILGLIVQGIISTIQNKKIEAKVDTYHKEVNGKMGELLITTKELGKQEGKAAELEKQVKQ